MARFIVPLFVIVETDSIESANEFAAESIACLSEAYLDEGFPTVEISADMEVHSIKDVCP